MWLLLGIVVISISSWLGIRQALQGHLKHARIRTPPGAATALKQIHLATFTFLTREQKYPDSLQDLFGLTVLDSRGEKVQFSRETIAQELGTNANKLEYLPGFMVLERLMPLSAIVLAYVPDVESPNVYTVIYWDGKLQEVRSSELEKQTQHLNHLLEGLPRDSVTHQ